MRRIDIAPLTPWITSAAVRHGSRPAGAADGSTWPSAAAALGMCCASSLPLQWLVAEGTPRKPLFRPGPLRQVVQRYALDGLQEDLPWRRDYAPYFELAGRGGAAWRSTPSPSCVNNAIDHSGGSQVTVSMRQTPLQLQLLVSDDGVGLFERIAGSFAIDDPMLAMLELEQGQAHEPATAPQSGHGLFFSSRLADVFDIHANRFGLPAPRLGKRRPGGPARPAPPMPRPGTSIYLAITLDTPRTLDAVLAGPQRQRCRLRLRAHPCATAPDCRRYHRRIAAVTGRRTPRQPAPGAVRTRRAGFRRRERRSATVLPTSCSASMRATTPVWNCCRWRWRRRSRLDDRRRARRGLRALRFSRSSLPLPLMTPMSTKLLPSLDFSND